MRHTVFPNLSTFRSLIPLFLPPSLPPSTPPWQQLPLQSVISFCNEGDLWITQIHILIQGGSAYKAHCVVLCVNNLYIHYRRWRVRPALEGPSQLFQRRHILLTLISHRTKEEGLGYICITVWVNPYWPDCRGRGRAQYTACLVLCLPACQDCLHDCLFALPPASLPACLPACLQLGSVAYPPQPAIDWNSFACNLRSKVSRRVVLVTGG